MTCKRAAWLLVIAIALVTGVFAQSVQVTVHETRFNVTDRNTGHYVTNLKRTDFDVYDNDVHQEIDSLDQRVQSPVSVAVLIDRSASVEDRFPFVLDAAATFVKSVVHNSDDRAMVVAFDSKVYLLQNWTTDTSLLVDKIRGLTPAGGTSVFDAVYKTCRDEFDVADTRKKVVVLITDGEDTTSRATYEQALEMAKQSDASVYVVGIHAEGSLSTHELQGRTVLTNLSETTGGRILYPENDHEQELQAVFQALQESMRNEYSLSYYLNVPPNNTYHRIRIETKDKNLIVHSPKRYYLKKPER